MHVLRFAVVVSRWLALAACLAVVGCSDGPELSPEAEALVREAAEAEQRAFDEAARRREEREPAIPPSEVLGDLRRDAEESATAGDDGGAALPATDGDHGEDRIGDDVTGDTDQGNDASTDELMGELPSELPDELPAQPTPPPLRRDRRVAIKWAEMQAGMTPPDVVALLGRPTRSADDFFLTYWYYGEGRDAGKVAFIRASQKTMAWDAPLH